MKQKLRLFTSLLLLAVASAAWGETVTFTFSELANANSWTNGTAYTTVELDPITLTAVGGGNNGKYYTSDSSWRMYDGGTVAITAANGYKITAVSSNPSQTFTINADGSASLSCTATIKFKTITVTYTSSGSTTETVATPTFNPAAGTYKEAKSVTISCATTGATIYYTTNGDTPTTDSNVYSSAINVSETTTIKAIAVKEGMENSAVASATYTIVEPFVIEDGVFVFDNSEGNNYGSDYQAGSVKVQSGVWTAGNVTMTTAGRNCWLNSTTLRIYAKSGNDAAGSLTFAVPENNVIKKIEVEGTSMNLFTATPGTYDAGEGNTTGTWTGAATTVTFTATGTAVFSKITVTYEEGTPVEEKTDIATINGISPTTLTVGDSGDFMLDATFAEGVTADDYTISWASDNTDFLELADKTYEAKAAGTANVTVTITPTDTEAYNVVSRTFAVTVEEEEPEGNWVLTDLAGLTSTDVFVIVGNNGSNYALANDKGTSSAPTAVNVTVEDDRLTSEVANNIKWNVSGNATEGYTFYPKGSTTTWLYCTNSNNGVRVGTNENNAFTIDSESGYLKHTATSRYLGIYNSVDWRCYTSAGGNIEDQTFAFYKFVAGSPVPSITARDVEIAYNATSGSISYTIKNAVEGGSLAATTEAQWLTLGDVSSTAVAFTAVANTAATARTAEVVLTYTYGEGSNVTNTITVTQLGNPNYVDNISDITETAKDYVIRGSIVAKSARGLVFGDGTGYVYYYKGSEVNYSVGDIKKVSGTMGSYSNVLQFTSSATIEDAETSNYNNAPAVTVVDATSMAAYSEGLHLSDYVQFEGTLIKSGNYYNVKVNGLGTDASISYPTDDQKTALNALENKNVIVKGYFAGVSGGHFSVVLESILPEAPQLEIITVSDLATDGNKFYSTLYYGEKNLKIPAGITASGVSVNGKSLVMGPVLAKDDVIAKGNAVLLTADDAGDYEFTVVADTEVDATISWDANLLRGNDEEATTEGGDVYYQLSRNANRDANSIGFYWGAANGEAFKNKAHRAYLAVTTEQAGGAKGFAFNDMATGIKSIAADTENGNAIIYNLAGQRVSNAQKGIYIVNGKKVVIR